MFNVIGNSIEFNGIAVGTLDESGAPASVIAEARAWLDGADMVPRDELTAEEEDNTALATQIAEVRAELEEAERGIEEAERTVTDIRELVLPVMRKAVEAMDGQKVAMGWLDEMRAVIAKLEAE